MSTSNTNAEEKIVRVRQHKVLGHPIIGAFLLIIHGFFFYQIALIFGGNSEELTCIVGIIAAILLLLIHRFWFREDFKGYFTFHFISNRKIPIAILIFFAVDIMVGIPGYMEYGFAGPSILGTLMALMAGITEEVVFRGLPITTSMRTYKDHGSYLPALFLPAVIFGLFHLLNLFNGVGISYVLLQVSSTLISGLFFCALYLRTGSLFPPMFVHVVHDLLCSFQANQTTGVSAALQTFSTADLMEDIIFDVVQILLVIWILRGEKEKIREIWHNVWA